MKLIEDVASKIMNKFSLFAEGVRVIMLINRGILNSNKGSRRWVNKLISTNPDEFRINLSKLLFQQQALGDADNRIYASVNPRKILSAVKYFQHKQIDLSTTDETIAFYRNIHNNFCSALMKPENRDANFFLIDYDSSSAGIANLYGKLNELNIPIIIDYKTPNGWHIVCSPFNPALIKDIPHCEVKKDALILLNA